MQAINLLRPFDIPIPEISFSSSVGRNKRNPKFVIPHVFQTRNLDRIEEGRESLFLLEWIQSLPSTLLAEKYKSADTQF